MACFVSRFVYPPFYLILQKAGKIIYNFHL